MLIKRLIDLYITCRFDKNGKKVNEKFEEELSALNYTSIKYYSRDNAEFFCFEDDKNKYFVFMGSNEFKDWLYNFFFFKREIPYKESGTNPKIKVHSGFFEMYLKLREDALYEAYLTSKPIIVIGHSLGSVIATFAALDFQYNVQVMPMAFITGTPRVGNYYFKKSYNKRVPTTVRITKGNDIVSHLPPRLFGFDHVAEEGYLHIGNKFSLRFISDHSIRDYEDCL